jgi:hypothetical protein
MVLPHCFGKQGVQTEKRSRSGVAFGEASAGVQPDFPTQKISCNQYFKGYQIECHSDYEI